MKRKVLFYGSMIVATIVLIVGIIVATYNIVNSMSVRNSITDNVLSDTKVIEEFTTTVSMQTEPIQEHTSVTDCQSENYEVSDNTPEVETKPSQNEFFESCCCCRIYIVQNGDNLTYVSTLAGCSIDEIVRLNNIENPDVIYPNMKLLLPVGK